MKVPFMYHITWKYNDKQYYKYVPKYLIKNRHILSVKHKGITYLLNINKDGSLIRCTVILAIKQLDISFIEIILLISILVINYKILIQVKELFTYLNN